MQNNFWIGLDKVEASESIPDPVEKAEIIVEGIDKDEASKNETSAEDAVAKAEITKEGM